MVSFVDVSSQVFINTLLFKATCGVIANFVSVSIYSITDFSNAVQVVVNVSGEFEGWA